MNATEATLVDLPTEIHEKIFGFLTVHEALKLSQTCKRLSLITQEEFFWQRLIKRDYGIDLRQDAASDRSVSSQLFFKKVLYRFGKFIGLWQRQTLGHYGALIQVVYEDWSLKLIEWCPPPARNNPHLPLRPVEFVKITIRDQERCIELSDASLFRDVQAEALRDVIITSSKPNALNVFLPKVKPFSDPDVELFDKMLKDYVTFETGKEEFDEEDFIDFLLLRKFNAKLNCRNVHGYMRLDTAQYLSKRLPIPPGIFKGTYGPHGIEIISVCYPSKASIEGVKLTGDPNVPMNKVTFKADLTKAMRFTEEFQKNFSCEALIPDEATSYEAIDFESSKQPQSQPFCLPHDAYDRVAGVDYRQCQYRFSAECQVAMDNYSNPEFVPGHLIVFDQDHFGVLFLTLRSMSLYVRISEDLTAVHFKSDKK